MRIAVLANADSWYYRDISRAAGDLQWECVRLDFSQLVAGILGKKGRNKNPDSRDNPSELISANSPPSVDDSPLPPSALPLSPSTLSTAHCPLSTAPDVVLVRTMPPGSLEQVVFRMDVLARWEAAGVRVINPPRALECAVDKYLTSARCHAAGLPVPETIVCETEDTALSAFETLGRDVVVKPLFGSEGRGILRVSDPDLALRTFRTLSRLQAVLYLQRFIPHPGYDVRILVLAGKILGGMKRFASPGDFRTNVSRQAHAEKHTPTSTEAELALRAANATGAWFAGIDLLYDQDGNCYVIEVNAVPGWKAFGRVNEMDVASLFLRRISTELSLREREKE